MSNLSVKFNGNDNNKTKKSKISLQSALTDESKIKMCTNKKTNL